ncbi:glucoamylase family protein [Chryseobacterium chendengshani]|uniref:glucoamylase family protein n=1 Tax=Chryseobacterium sp. LJ756 TaxID=2864113 RepID=UPI001C6433F7|nr:glucoamylase family protein [Chryseobacterium sp. LJ756]MBW7674887.1 beta-glucosidase [Chryseobacterium sp. LJ756]
MKNFKSAIFFLGLIVSSCSSEDNTPTAGTPIGGGGGTEIPNNYTDTQLVEMVQKDALKYFWDYAESNSKLARERYHTDNPAQDAHVVSAGGSGFGLMTILVGVKNGYVTKAEAVSRLTTALNFLQNANRFHGAWPHWMNGNNGQVIPFSPQDDGGDLVETAFLAQGLICVREYFKNSTDSAEIALSQKADTLFKGIEWSWYTKGENTLYWHWSPNYNFQMNMQLKGFDETLITYVMAAASSTFTITKPVYQQGWARSGVIANAGSQYGFPLVVNHNGAVNTVGPMFWSHYSFLGLDPRGLTDDYVNYGNSTSNHAKIMYQYSVANPKGWQGYNSKSWGLTASYSRNADGSTGYSAHQPNNDLGIISPTAALSSMPYTPVESMNMLRFLYNENYSKYIGVAGPYDAYSVHYNWVTPRYLAIDQGTIAPMIENNKSQFLWQLFMNAPDIRQGLTKLGFHSTQYGF